MLVIKVDEVLFMVQGKVLWQSTLTIRKTLSGGRIVTIVYLNALAHPMNPRHYEGATHST
jgi:hypothetical protein